MFASRLAITTATVLLSITGGVNADGEDIPAQAAPVEVFPLPANTVFERQLVGEGGTVTAAGEQLVYSNTLGAFGANLGQGNLVSDDIATTAPNGCKLRRYEFPVLGKVNPAGLGGPYIINFALYSSCPGSVPFGSIPTLRIPGTSGQRSFINECQNSLDDDADGAANDGCPAVGPVESGAQCANNTDDDADGRINDGCPVVGSPELDADVPRLITFIAGDNVPLPTNFWLGIKFNRNNAGVVFGAPPLTGFSCDQYDYPGSACTAWAGGFPAQPHASFNLEVYADAACSDSFTGYKNNNPDGPTYNPGAGVTFADDIELGVNECQMIAYEVAVQGDSTYTFDLRRNCNSSVIAGTEREFTVLGTNEPRIARFTFTPAIPLPNDFFISARISAASGGVIVSGQQACIGLTADSFQVVDAAGCYPTVYPPPFTGLPRIYAAFSASITCAGAAPVGACCDMVFPQCVGGADDGRPCCPPDANVAPYCYSDPALTDRNPHCTPPGSCEFTCREVPQMNCPWPWPQSTSPDQPHWIESASCDPDPFPFLCGAAACCRPDDVCENLTLNQCNAVPPLEAPHVWKRGIYCGDPDQTCPINACLRREGDCTVAHEGTGCRDSECCNEVCSTDAFCCTVEWDRICAELADSLCYLNEHDYCFAARESDGALLVAADSVTSFSNSRASGGTTDPRFCCSPAAPNAVGYGTVWFKFIATDTSARISTCGSDATGDSLINVFAVGDPATNETACATLSVIACSDDVEGCGNGRHGRICVKDLTPGRPYYVMVGSKTPELRGLYQLEIRSPCFEEPIWNSDDCNGNSIADGCELGRRVAADCNGNNRLDECDIASGGSFDCDGNAIPDDCDGLIETLTPLSTEPSGAFGTSVVMDGSWLVVGSGFEFTEMPRTKYPLHIYRRTPVGWRLAQTIVLPIAPTYVRIDDGWAVITSDLDDVASLLRLDGDLWVDMGTLQGPAIDGCARRGYPVAIDGDRIALSKGYCEYGPYETEELVFIFRRDGLNWVKEAQLKAPSGDGSYSLFGASVALGGDRLIVGARASASAHVFRRENESWAFETTLYPPDEAPTFGRSAAFDGRTAVVGANLADAAYVFTFDGTTWSYEAKLHPSGATFYPSFGWSVGIVGNSVVIGAIYDATYIFHRQGTQWIEQAELSPPSFQNDAFFGYGVATDGALLAVGAPGFDSATLTEVGIVYVFQPPKPDCNENDIPDRCDLRELTSFDCDHDGVPDECLGLSPFDADADGDTDLFDVAVFMRCYRGVGIPVPESICTIFDVQHNCFTDLSDFAALLSVLSGPKPP